MELELATITLYIVIFNFIQKAVKRSKSSPSLFIFASLEYIVSKSFVPVCGDIRNDGIR